MFFLQSKALVSPSLCSRDLVSSPLTPLSSSSCFRPQKLGRESHSSRLAVVCDLQGQATETTTKPDQLSPRERRKLRNERRQELKGSKGSWKEEVEIKLDVKKKPPKGWEQILDINRLAIKGYVWWMLSVPKNAEKLAADYIDVVFPERFPGVKFEVFSPSVPARKILKDGRYSDARHRLYPGCLLLRCVLNREVYDLIRNVPRVRDFYGTKAATSVSEMIMPAAASIIEIDELLKRIEREEAEFKILNEAAENAADERERLEREDQEKAETEALPPPQLEKGAMVQINAGPFINHTGIVAEIDHEQEAVKLLVTVFGKQTAANLSIDTVTVLQGAEAK